VTGTEAGYVALAAGGVALLALLLALWSFRWLRRIRRAQQALVAGENADLVEFAVGMQTRMEKVEDVVTKAVNEVGAQRKRLDSAYQRRAIVRYDAIKDVGGRQSTTIALLDASRSGVVLSSIHHRDQARLYAKQVVEGRGELELSPEEQEAVRIAISGPAAT
jgi:HAMP domain-containing protein